MGTIETLNVTHGLAGFVKIWRTDIKTGEVVLLVDKQNKILKQGAKIISQLLGGKPESKIWGMYIGYNNDPSYELTSAPTIDVDYSHPFSQFSENPGGMFGYLREPLTFTPNYLSSTSYEDNTVLFSTMITSANSVGGAEFITGTSNIYEVALIAAPALNDVTKDLVFSRTNFNPVQYNSSYNFTITWGVRILVPA
jgi:hypothetical protein